MPICTKCKEEKQVEEMSLDRSRREGISSWCKRCRSVSSKNWKKSNPDKVRKQRESADSSYTDRRNWMLKHRYGISLGEYTSMLEAQSYLCNICKKDSRDMTYHLHVDHDHSSGIVRGLLCSPCNLYLGYINDNPSVAENLKDHIKGCHSNKTNRERQTKRKKEND